tara:strand:+ start:485 stop:676 length:192 start_codon:yes stop_codon:yes gene_type:complete
MTLESISDTLSEKGSNGIFDVLFISRNLILWKFNEGEVLGKAVEFIHVDESPELPITKREIIR